MTEIEFLDDSAKRDYALTEFPAFMDTTKQHPMPRTMQFLLAVLSCVFFSLPAWCQDRSADESSFRGNRAEIAVTIKDNSGAVVTTPATVRVYRSGMLTGEAMASKGRAFFILNSLGDYTIKVEASGYQTAQKDISLPVAIKDEEDIVVRRDSSAGDLAANSGRPVLAPKAKEALEKGLQALNDEKLDQAEKLVGEAMKLAPGNPEVLYVQGVVYLKRRNWAKAQSVLEKATQIDPNHARAFAALGMALADEGKYDQAIAPLERSLQLDPGGWETHWTLAKAYYHHEQYDEALKTSQEALAESHGAAPEIELLVAQSLTAVGRYGDAAQALRGFLKNHGDQPGAASARRWLDRLTTDGKI